LKTVARGAFPKYPLSGSNSSSSSSSSSSILSHTSSPSRLSSFGSTTSPSIAATKDRFGFQRHGSVDRKLVQVGGGGGGGAVARVTRHKIERTASKRRRRRLDRDNRRLLKWTHMLDDWNGTVLASPQMVDRRVRKGVPMPLRADVWCKMSGAQAIANDPLRRWEYDALQKTPSSKVPWEKEVLQESLRIYHGR
jgi:hypothetical protein